MPRVGFTSGAPEHEGESAKAYRQSIMLKNVPCDSSVLEALPWCLKRACEMKTTIALSAYLITPIPKLSISVGSLNLRPWQKSKHCFEGVLAKTVSDSEPP